MKKFASAALEILIHSLFIGAFLYALLSSWGVEKEHYQQLIQGKIPQKQYLMEESKASEKEVSITTQTIDIIEK